MPYILLGIGILIVGLAILIPEKKSNNKLNNGDTATSFSETASASDAFYDNLNAKLDEFIDELDSNLNLAGDRLEATIKKFAALQDAIDNSVTAKKDDSRTKHLPQKHRDVLALKEKGLNVEEIATRLNIGKGETELILSLYEAGDKH